MSCYEHPAERMIYDEQGRAVTLGLSEAEIRLQCLAMAMSPPDGEDVAAAIRNAGKMAAFVLGTDKDHPATEGEPDPHAAYRAETERLRGATGNLNAATIAGRAVEGLRDRIAELSRDLGEAYA